MRLASLESYAAEMPTWLDHDERVEALRARERALVLDAMADVRGREEWLGERCHFCGRVFLATSDGALVLYGANVRARTQEARLAYPRYFARGLLAHRQCGPDVGYAIPLRRLVRKGAMDAPSTEDSLGKWIHHLREKRWGRALEQDLFVAHILAASLATQPARRAPMGVSVSRVSAPADATRYIAPSLRARVLERDGFACRRCGAERAEGAKLVIDHIHPFSQGGPTSFENLQTLCRDCNAGKAAHAPHPHDLRDLQ